MRRVWYHNTIRLFCQKPDRKAAKPPEGKDTRLSNTVKRRLWWTAALVALAVFAVAMTWLHYQQLCSPGGGNDPYTSDLGQHLAFARRGMIYSTTSLLVGPAYALGGRWGIAVLLTIFHLAAVGIFARGLSPALPRVSCPVRLLFSLAVYFSQAVWIPRGGYWYQGTVIGTVYHNVYDTCFLPGLAGHGCKAGLAPLVGVYRSADDSHQLQSQFCFCLCTGAAPAAHC